MSPAQSPAQSPASQRELAVSLTPTPGRLPSLLCHLFSFCLDRIPNLQKSCKSRKNSYIFFIQVL